MGFDFENFDYEYMFRELKNDVVKPNIMICGASGIGKSSMINSIFCLSTSSDKYAHVGEEGKAQTVGVNLYEGQGINIYDTEGYIITEKSGQKKFMNDIIGWIDKQMKEYPEEFTKHIHEVWYCISAPGARIDSFDIEICNEINKRNIPFCIVLMKTDRASLTDLDKFKKIIRKEIKLNNSTPIGSTNTNIQVLKEKDVSVFYYSSNGEIQNKEKLVEKDKLIQWSIENLDLSLANSMISSLRISLSDKKNRILKETVPLYSASAATAVVGTSVVNVPFSDAPVLMTIQIKMAMDIINKFDLNTDLVKMTSDILGTSFISYIGKTVATQIISILPGCNLVKAAVNVSVAASVTAILGVAVTLICDQYLNLCLKNNGCENIPFYKFLKDNLKEMVKYVSDNKEKFNISAIVNKSLAKNDKIKECDNNE